MGRFMLGSTVVLLFPEARPALRPGVAAGRSGAPRRGDGRRSGRTGSRHARRLRRRQRRRCARSPRRSGRALLPQLELAFGDADIVPDALPAALAGAPIAVIDHTALPIDDRARAATGLRDVVFLGTGARSYMDPEALAAIGIAVHLIKGYGDTAVAECAIGLLFDAARKFAAMDRAMRDGRWLRSEGTQLAGKTLGLIGYGGIAAEVARMALGIGMKVIAWNRTAKAARRASSSSPIERLLAESDAVSLHLLLTDETRGFLSAARIAAMRRGVLLVNTARGALVDEDGDGRGAALGPDRPCRPRRLHRRAAAAGPRADDARQRDAVGALGLSHAGGEHAPDRGGVRALRADRGG